MSVLFKLELISTFFFTFFLSLIFLCRPLTEEEIVVPHILGSTKLKVVSSLLVEGLVGRVSSSLLSTV